MSNLDKDYMTFPCGCKFKVKDWNIKPYDGLPKLELDFYNIPFSCQATWELIASGRTRGIFQLESNLGRTYARKLEAETIDHLAALTAVLRPGCMSCQFEGKSMTNHFVDRKQNLEPVSYQESRLEPFLNTTFGVMIYQEQMIAFSKALASYTPEQANSLRKSVGKKDVEGLFKLEESFIQGCVKNGITEESARKIFDDIKSSGRYLFNACISGDTIINVFNGMETFFTVEEMLRIKADESFAIDSGRLTEHKDWNKNGNYGCGWSMQEDGLIRPNIIQDIQFSGIRHVYKITLSNGYCIKVTDNHKFPTPDGMKTTSELNINDELYIRGEIIENGVYTSEIKIIISIEDVGRENTYDVTMCTPHNHNFVANQGIVTCNSHAYSYGHISYITAYLKAHFPLHFFTAYLKRAKDSDELRELMSEISLFNITIKNPSIGNLCKKFNIKDGYIQYGYAELKNVGLQTAETLISSVEELEKKLNKTAIEFTWYEFLLFLSTKIDSRSVYNLISCGLLDNTGISRQRQLAEYSAFVSLTGKPELKFIEEEGSKYEDLISLIEGMLKAGETTIVKKKEVFVSLIKGQRRAKVESILSGLYNPGTSWEDSVNWVCDVETEIMGTAISKSKTKSFERLGNIKCLDFCLGKGNNGIRLVAEVIDVDERIIKSGNNKGKKFANTVLKDSSGEVECTIFSSDWQDLRSDIIKGNVLLIHGRRNQDKSLKIEKVELL